jgi:hypothetical protein
MKNIQLSLRLSLLSLFLTAALSTINAQTPDNPLFRHIPPDATQVFDINVKSLMLKVDWLTVLKQVQGMGKGDLMSTFAGVSNSGIDLTRDIIVVTKSSLRSDTTYTTILVNITDSAKLTAFLTKQEPGMHTLHLGGKDHVRADATKAYVYNDKLLVLVTRSKPKFASNDPAIIAKLGSALGRKGLVALHGFDHSPYNTDLAFKNGFADDADIHMWNSASMGIGSIAKLMKMAPGASGLKDLPNAIKQMKTSKVISSVSFEPGKIVFHTAKILNGDDSAVLSHYAIHPISDRIISLLPPGNLLGMFAMNIDVNTVSEMLMKVGIGQKLDSMLQKKSKDLTLKDLLHAFKGDVFVLAYAPENPSPSDKDPRIYAVFSIGDRPSFDKILTSIKNHEAEASDDTTSHHKKMHPYWSIQDDLVAFSGSQQTADGFFNHPQAAANPASRLLTPEMRNNPSILAVDFQALSDYIGKVLPRNDSVPNKAKMFLGILKNLDSFTMTTGTLKDGRMESKLELRFTDADKNGLASLLNIAMAAAGGGR